MLAALVRFSVRRPGIVLGVALALLLYGLDTLSRATLDVFPEFAPPQVSIQTEAPGFSPEQVEILVTKPLEDAINGVAGVVLVRSQSIQGLSVITAILADGVDLYRARQMLAERLGEVSGRLPAGIEPPILAPLTSSSSTVLMIGITSKTRSRMEQRTFVDWTLRPRLLATPGVAKVAVFGGDVRQLQIQVNPERLRAYGIGMQDVLDAARSATGIRGAGVMDDANQRIVITTEGQLLDPAVLARSVVKEQGGAILRLGDLGRVVEGAAPRFGEGTINGELGSVIVVSAQFGANTKEVAGAVERALTDLAPAIEQEGLTLHPDLFRPATFIDLALRNVTVALLLGALLVAVVLFIFLADVGAAAISLGAIPLSLLAAIVVLKSFGIGVNTLTLGGLAIALGEVVDDAIIDVENIARRLRLNRDAIESSPVGDVVIAASLEVRGSVVYATFIVALVFLPVLMLSGVQGALFRPLGLAYILATVASLVVALTVTPALSLLLLARRGHRDHQSRFLAWLRLRFERALADLLHRPASVMFATIALCAAAGLTLPFFASRFLPEFHEGHYVVHMSAVPGSSLDESVRLGQMVTAALRADPRIRSVAQRAGRAELSEDTWGPHYSELEVDLQPLSGKEAEVIQEDMRRLLAPFPGVSFAIRGFLTERIEETLTGSTAEVVVKLYGENLDSLDHAAQEVAGVIRAVPGASDVQYDPPPVVPGVTVRLNPEAMANAGLAADQVLATIETATRGTRVAQTFEGNRSTDVVVILDSAARSRPEDLRTLPVIGAGRRLVSLSEVASIARTSGRYQVSHQGTRRVQTVTTNVAARDVAGFTRELESRLRATRLPGGIYAEVGGTATAQRTANQELLLHGLLAAGGILMLLWLAFGESRRLLLVLANLPFALVGGVLAVFATGGELSLGSMVGFVTLFGIATRNAVMLVSHYEHLVRREGAAWNAATALRGAGERLGPILMTAAVTGLGLLPLAIGSGDPGREIEGPMAIVILGGLATSTLLTLFVLPTLAFRYVDFESTGGK